MAEPEGSAEPLRPPTGPPLLDEELASFLEAALSAGALKLGGPFRLKDGSSSPYFFDLGRLSGGEELALLGRCFARAIDRAVGVGGCDVVFGPAYKGIPLAAVTAVELSRLWGGQDVRYASERKEPKLHGEGSVGGEGGTRWLGGPIGRGDRVVLVDDVMTSGGTKVEAVASLRAAGLDLRLLGLVVALDRQERDGTGRTAAEAFEEGSGLAVHSLLDLPSLVAALEGRPGVDRALLGALRKRSERPSSAYLSLLRDAARRTGSFICMGIDPDPNTLPPGEGSVSERVLRFYESLREAMERHGVLPGAVKPNLAWFEALGIEGLQVLVRLIDGWKSQGIPVILDAKRGDIGPSSAAYARAAFDVWKGDAVTVSPYMGTDSLGPFLDSCDRGKGVYILCRTSNPGASDVQDIRTGEGRTVYEVVAARATGPWYRPGVGVVLGALRPEVLTELAPQLASFNRPVPVLIPGVGAQGGTASEVVSALRRGGYDLSICRINVSRGIARAYQLDPAGSPAKAGVRALERLNEEWGP